MYNRIIFLSLIFCVQMQAGTFREKIKAKIKERLVERMENAPAPKAIEVQSMKAEKSGEYVYKMSIDGQERYFKIYIPQGFNFKIKNPVVFALHGGGGDMEIQSNESYYHQQSSADKFGYLVVFPNGHSKFKSGKLATWNAGTCCGSAIENKIDDVKFLSSIIELLKNKLNIDSQKVFFTGMSNGAMMSYKMACEKSDLVKAIMPVAGTDNTIECKPTKPVSVFHIHAKDDDHVLFTGGFGKNAKKDASTKEYNSVDHSIKKWVKFNSCPEKPKKVLDVEGASCDLYSPCKNGTVVKLCVTDQGGHSWPGGEKPRGGKGSSAIDATKLMWELFKELK